RPGPSEQSVPPEQSVREVRPVRAARPARATRPGPPGQSEHPIPALLLRLRCLGALCFRCRSRNSPPWSRLTDDPRMIRAAVLALRQGCPEAVFAAQRPGSGLVQPRVKLGGIGGKVQALEDVQGVLPGPARGLEVADRLVDVPQAR